MTANVQLGWHWRAAPLIKLQSHDVIYAEGAPCETFAESAEPFCPGAELRGQPKPNEVASAQRAFAFGRSAREDRRHPRPVRGSCADLGLAWWMVPDEPSPAPWARLSPAGRGEEGGLVIANATEAIQFGAKFWIASSLSLLAMTTDTYNRLQDWRARAGRRSIAASCMPRPRLAARRPSPPDRCRRAPAPPSSQAHRCRCCRRRSGPRQSASPTAG